MPSTLIIDMGGGSLKVGLAGEQKPKIIDNCIFKSKTLSGKTFIGSQIEDCNNLSSLYCIMPFKKGYLNNWEVQMQILDTALKKTFKEHHHMKLSDCNLIVTEPYFNFASTKETMNEVFFEEYQFAGLMRSNPALLAAYKYQAESVQRLSRYCMVIDSGYSFTHLVPMGDGHVMSQFVLRLPVGGKVLTNRLVEIVSYRHLDVRSEVYIMNQCKEDVCYVSTDFWKDLETARSAFVCLFYCYGHMLTSVRLVVRRIRGFEKMPFASSLYFRPCKQMENVFTKPTEYVNGTHFMSFQRRQNSDE
ncbi:hypothetical protein P879_11858 [Paragonimus westermani]|uniref:Actin-related protein 6 n=1 Tax=Paragonimus westermani TaxID=34504 RepID=A0A8T0D3X6_9TREM|nr:hypothetical protein P879_11858 [Paragonimus westermani]